jgi:monothiol glutaredoxin
MSQPEITTYLKTSCGWSKGVRAVMAKYSLAFTDKDIIQNPAFRFEMEQRSGQSLSPCVEINGVMLPDISGEEVEAYMLEKGIVTSTDVKTDVPLNAACSDAEHAAMAQGISPGIKMNL